MKRLLSRFGFDEAVRCFSGQPDRPYGGSDFQRPSYMVPAGVLTTYGRCTVDRFLRLTLFTLYFVVNALSRQSF